MHDPVILRYFDLVGRAQPLRHMLSDAAVDFEDLRVTEQYWRDHCQDVAFAGPFAGLPTLTWGGATIAETLPIATFLDGRLGYDAGMDSTAVARSAAITSHCYLEVMVRIGEVIWASALYAGADMEHAMALLMTRMWGKLDGLERLAAAALPWLTAPHPTSADFFAAEAIEACRTLTGATYRASLTARYPSLLAHAARVRTRPSLAASWQARPHV